MVLRVDVGRFGTLVHGLMRGIIARRGSDVHLLAGRIDRGLEEAHVRRIITTTRIIVVIVDARWR